MKKIISLIIAVFFLGTSSLFAEIKVLKVKGTVAYKTGKDWNAVTTGMELPDGVKISTGANSSAELRLNVHNHTITIKPYTVMQVFSKTDSKSSDTNVGLKRGNIIVNVPKDKKVKTVFKVTTPIATSSVRGTREDIFSGTRVMDVYALDGNIDVVNKLGRKKNIRGRQVFRQKKGEPAPGSVLDDVRDNAFLDFDEPDTSHLDSMTGEDAKVGVDIIWP